MKEKRGRRLRKKREREMGRGKNKEERTTGKGERGRNYQYIKTSLNPEFDLGKNEGQKGINVLRQDINLKFTNYQYFTLYAHTLYISQK